MKQSYLMKPAVAAAAMLIAAQAAAVPAKPGVRRVAQPDGTMVEVVCRGDERGHDFFTPGGSLLVRDADGYFTYAVTDADGNIKAGDIRLGSRDAGGNLRAPRSEGLGDNMRRALDRKYRALGDKPKYLFSGTAFPCTGEPHALVLLVEFSDKGFSMDDPAAFYNDQLNGENFTTYGATGSVRKYFIDNSNGLFRPTFDAKGPIRLSKNRAYYGSNDMYDQDMHPDEMVLEALAEIADDTDFSVYDHDGDGYIDNIFVIYAGTGENTSYDVNDVWPHSDDLLNYEDIVLPTYNGVKPNRYGCTNEYDIDLRRPDGIGTFVHEFSHVLGLPDLYVTNGSPMSWTPGRWSVLDSGPYNNDGRTPPCYSAHERYALNWVEPQYFTETGEYSIKPLTQSNECFIVETPTEDDFFLLECRRNEGWDAYLPGEGMLVWHVLFDQKRWDLNTVNNGRYRQFVDLLEANNDYDSKKGNAFPYGSNTSLGATTTPAMVSWNKEDPGVALSEISRNAGTGVVSFLATVDKDITGVDAVEAEQGEAEYYTLQGVRLANPEKGLYIRVQNGKADKVVL